MIIRLSLSINCTECHCLTSVYSGTTTPALIGAAFPNSGRSIRNWISAGIPTLQHWEPNGSARWTGFFKAPQDGPLSFQDDFQRYVKTLPGRPRNFVATAWRLAANLVGTEEGPRILSASIIGRELGIQACASGLLFLAGVKVFWVPIIWSRV